MTTAAPTDAQPGVTESDGGRSLSLGARLSVVLGVLIWVAAGVLFFIPIPQPITGGGTVSCGSAVDPVDEPLIRNSCGPVADENRVQAIALLCVGAVVAVGGCATFGLRKSTQEGFVVTG